MGKKIRKSDFSIAKIEKRALKSQKQNSRELILISAKKKRPKHAKFSDYH